MGVLHNFKCLPVIKKGLPVCLSTQSPPQTRELVSFPRSWRRCSILNKQIFFLNIDSISINLNFICVYLKVNFISFNCILIIWTKSNKNIHLLIQTFDLLFLKYNMFSTATFICIKSQVSWVNRRLKYTQFVFTDRLWLMTKIEAKISTAMWSS